MSARLALFSSDASPIDITERTKNERFLVGADWRAYFGSSKVTGIAISYTRQTGFVGGPVDKGQSASATVSSRRTNASLAAGTFSFFPCHAVNASS